MVVGIAYDALLSILLRFEILQAFDAACKCSIAQLTIRY